MSDNCFTLKYIYCYL